MRLTRRRFIDHLKNNPDNRRQIECTLTNGGNGRCAMGLGLEGIGIDLRDGYANEPYEEGAAALGFNINSTANNDGYDLVWRLNDRGLSFAAIAERLEEEWEESVE